MRYLLLLAAGLSLSGCATLNKEECLSADWHALGQQDGSHGYAASRLQDHRSACHKHGVAPDPQAYAAGRRIGLRQFCTPSSGYRQGVKGREGVVHCAADQREAFRAAYGKGLEIHDQQQRVDELQRRIRDKDKEIEDLLAKISANEKLMDAPETKSKERSRLYRENREHYHRMRRLEREVIDLDRRLDEARDWLHTLRRESPYASAASAHWK